MTPKALLWVVIVGICRGALTATVPSSKGDKSQVLMVVSFDSFHQSYFDKKLTPNLNQFRKEGVSVPYLRNVFTTKTFPNHFSIATGLYPDRHGVTNNVVFDNESRQKLKYGYDYYHMDEEILPIWTLNEESGGHSSCILFPASNFKFHNRSCTFTEVYPTTLEPEQLIRKAFDSITDEKTPSNLVMLYFDQPDSTAHEYGPDSQQAMEKVANTDRIAGLIVDAVKQHKLEKRLNLIFLSDHGMQTVSMRDMIDLRNYTDTTRYKTYGSSPVVQVVPNPGEFENVLNSLRETVKKVGHFQVYTNEELLERWHYRNDRRVGPITIVADVGYTFNDFIDHIHYYKNRTSTTDEYGVHGYDNSVESMWAVFMAQGPAFKDRFEGKPFDNVDLYHLFCKVLNLSVPANLDGNAKNIQQFLATSSSSSSPTNKLRKDNNRWMEIAVIALIVITVIAAVSWGLLRCRRNRKKFLARKLALDSAFRGQSETRSLITAFDSDEEI